MADAKLQADKVCEENDELLRELRTTREQAESSRREAQDTESLVQSLTEASQQLSSVLGLQSPESVAGSRPPRTPRFI